MSITTYDKGDVIRVTNTWVDLNGAPSDPTVVQFQYREPDGDITTLTYLTDAAIVRDSAGIYHVDLTLSQSGSWFVRALSTGGGAAAEKEYFVKHGAF